MSARQEIVGQSSAFERLKTAWENHQFDLARDYVAEAVREDPFDRDRLEYAAWAEIQADVDQAFRYGERYLLIRQGIDPGPFEASARVEMGSEADSVLDVVHDNPKADIAIVLPIRLDRGWDPSKHLVHAIRNTTARPEMLDIVLRVDLDDHNHFVPAAVARLHRFSPRSGLRVVWGARKRGYLDIGPHTIAAILQSGSTASYVVTCTDRTVFTASGWDDIVRALLPSIGIACLSAPYRLRADGHHQAVWGAFTTRPDYATFALEMRRLRDIRDRLDDAEVPWATALWDMFLAQLSAASGCNADPRSIARLGSLVRATELATLSSVPHRDRLLWATLSYHRYLDAGLDRKAVAIAHELEWPVRPAPSGAPLRQRVASFIDMLRNGVTARLVPSRLEKAARAATEVALADLKRDGDWVAAYARYQRAFDSRMIARGMPPHPPPRHERVGRFTRVAENPTAALSLLLGVRLGGNTASRLPDFLASVKRTSHGLVEVLVGADEDDDTPRIEADLRASGLAGGLLISQRGRGYYDLHVKYDLLFDHIAPTSQFVMICSDDSYFSREGWDAEALAGVDANPNAQFVNFSWDRDRAAVGGDRFLWWIYQRGPATAYPCMHRRLIEAAAIDAPTPEWSRFGPSLMVDSYFEMLRMYVEKHAGSPITVMVPGAIRRRPETPDTRVTAEKLRDRYFDALRLYQMMLEPANQAHVARIAARAHAWPAPAASAV